jgi:hypothetical protein
MRVENQRRKMVASNRRAFSRIHFVAPGRLYLADSDDQFESIIIDYSPGGVGCKADKFIAPDTNVRVMTLNYACGSFGPECHRSFRAKTRWLLKLDDDASRYALGLQFLCVCHDICEEEHSKIQLTCDLCGVHLAKKAKVCNLNRYANLCPNCYEHYQMLPEGPLKDSIGRFIYKNV